MTDKKKPHQAEPGTASNTEFDSRHPTAPTVTRQCAEGRNADTHEVQLLETLRSGHAVDPLQAWLHLGIYRLADCFLNLPSKGWPVMTEHVNVLNRYGEACHVAVACYPLEVQP